MSSLDRRASRSPCSSGAANGLFVAAQRLDPAQPERTARLAAHGGGAAHPAEERFDAVIIDTPPLLPVTDAAVLASTVDGTVLVSRCGKTTTTQARQRGQLAQVVDARLLGCVLNMIPTRGTDAYTYYDYSRPEPRPRRTLRAPRTRRTPRTAAAPAEPSAVPAGRVSAR